MSNVDIDDIIKLVEKLNGNDFSRPPAGYIFEIDLSAELVSNLPPNVKKELFEDIFAFIKKEIASIQTGNFPLYIDDFIYLKELIKDNPLATKNLFFYLTHGSRIDLIVTKENLTALRSLYPANESLQKDSIPEIKESLIKEKQLFSSAAARGLFAGKTNLPFELAEKIGSNLDLVTVRAVTQVCKAAGQQANQASDEIIDSNLRNRI